MCAADPSGYRPRTYTELSVAMLSVADYLFLRFPVIPIGYQLFACADGTSPLTESEWMTFITANEGKFPKSDADWEGAESGPEWEAWDKFPDGTRRGRYYGRGNKNELNWLLGAIKEVTEILAEYRDVIAPKENLFFVPKPLKWDVPNGFHGNSPPDSHTVVEAVCRWTGQKVTDSGLLGLEEKGLEITTVEHLPRAVADAIEFWIPCEIELVDPTCAGTNV